MTPYAQAISAATGATDRPTLALVEDLMRIDRAGLDGLSRAHFVALARRAHADIQLMQAQGWLIDYCEALGLATPTTI